MSKNFFRLSFRATGETFDPAVQDFYPTGTMSLSLEMTRLQADFGVLAELRSLERENPMSKDRRVTRLPKSLRFRKSKAQESAHA
jgi:hypothetical protein